MRPKTPVELRRTAPARTSAGTSERPAGPLRPASAPQGSERPMMPPTPADLASEDEGWDRFTAGMADADSRLAALDAELARPAGLQRLVHRIAGS